MSSKQGLKEEVLKLMEECNTLASEMKLHLEKPAFYRRYTLVDKLVVSVLFPIIAFAAAISCYRLMVPSCDETEIYAVKMVACVFGIAVYALCRLLYVEGRTVIFLPFSDKKAVEILREKIAELQSSRTHIAAERKRLAEELTAFDELRSIIVEELKGGYVLHEMFYTDLQICDFYVSVRFQGERRSENYQVNSDLDYEN